MDGHQQVNVTRESLVASQLISSGYTHIDIYPGLALELQYIQYWRNLSNLIKQIFCGIRVYSQLLTRRNEPVGHIQIIKFLSMFWNIHLVRLD